MGEVKSSSPSDSGFESEAGGVVGPVLGTGGRGDLRPRTLRLEIANFSMEGLLVDLLLLDGSSKPLNSSSQLCQHRDLIEATSQYRPMAKPMVLMSPVGNCSRIQEPSS